MPRHRVHLGGSTAFPLLLLRCMSSAKAIKPPGQAQWRETISRRMPYRSRWGRRRRPFPEKSFIAARGTGGRPLRRTSCALIAVDRVTVGPMVMSRGTNLSCLDGRPVAGKAEGIFGGITHRIQQAAALPDRFASRSCRMSRSKVDRATLSACMAAVGDPQRLPQRVESDEGRCHGAIDCRPHCEGRSAQHDRAD